MVSNRDDPSMLPAVELSTELPRVDHAEPAAMSEGPNCAWVASVSDSTRWLVSPQFDDGGRR